MIHKRTEYRRMQEFRAKKRLKDNYNNSTGFPCGCYYKDGRLVESGRGSRSKWLKQQSNKKIRRGKDIGQGGWYRKKFDYWWELY